MSRMLAWRDALRRRSRAATTGPFAAARLRLVLLNLGVVASILAIMAVAIYLFEARALDQQMTEQLTAATYREPPAHIFTEHQSPDFGDDDGLGAYDPRSPNVFTIGITPTGTVVWDPQRATIKGMPDLSVARTVLAGKAKSTLVTVHMGTHDFRLLTVAAQVNGVLVGAVQSGVSLDEYDKLMRNLVLVLIFSGLIVLLISALASLLLADRALAPSRLAYERQRQFIAAASHELRTPLALMRSQVERIERHLGKAIHSPEASLTPEAQTDLHVTANETLGDIDAMTNLLNDLLILARAPDSAIRLAPEPLDARAMLKEIAGQAATLPQAVGKTIRTLLGDEPILIVAEAARLRQGIWIILENALRYTPTGGTIEMSATIDRDGVPLPGHHGHARISIHDTGPGIAAHDLPHVFEPFYRADHARTHGDGQTHTGLGLAIARWIVQAHHGSIHVESAPDAGATFVIDLPLRIDPDLPHRRHGHSAA
jgi:two-component system, OmpR family, sensor histidine kinase CiaH